VTTLPATTLPATTSPATTTPATTSPAPVGAAELVYVGATDRPIVVLTFDAGSDRGYAEEILGFLADRGIRATFGMTGRWAEDNSELVRRMADDGHTLMNHTYDHPHMETLSTRERTAQLERTESIVLELTGSTTKPWFRPPYGAYNPQVLEDVGAAGYRYSVMWTVDSLGWQGLPAGDVAARCLGGAEPGAIFLLHVGAASTDYAALDAIVSGLEDLGYEFVTIPELIS
jgi:peptidoglycan/xylan/chitin deacetylase (PgdA/CDA1 family)